jgi:uncharacterized protein involved in exopolysaccharide biosynthesis
MEHQQSADRPVHLRDYVRVLRKHKWVITGVFLVTVISTAIWTFLQVPIYQASTAVLIDPEPPRVLTNIAEVSPIGSTATEYYQTQYEIIKSRPVLERAVDTLGLKQRIPGLAEAANPHYFVLGGLSVEPRRNTRLVDVKFKHDDPAFAAEVCNAVAHAYAKYNVEMKLKGAREAVSWLTEQMSGLKTKLQDSATALQNYRVKAGILGLQEQRQITTAKIMDFNRAYLEAQAQRLSTEAKLNELRQITRDRAGAMTIFTVADSAMIRKAKEALADLEAERSKLVMVYKDKHPEILKIDAKIQQITGQIDAELQTMIRAVGTEHKVAKAREETLLGNVNQLRREGQDLSEKEIQFLTLQRESDSNQQLYEAVLKRLKETGITGGDLANNVRVIEEATKPGGPIRPRKSLNLMLSVIAGLFVGVGIAFALEYMDTTVKLPEEVEQQLGIPVLGIVPHFRMKS